MPSFSKLLLPHVPSLCKCANNTHVVPQPETCGSVLTFPPSSLKLHHTPPARARWSPGPVDSFLRFLGIWTFILLGSLDLSLAIPSASSWTPCFRRVLPRMFHTSARWRNIACESHHTSHLGGFRGAPMPSQLPPPHKAEWLAPSQPLWLWR